MLICTLIKFIVPAKVVKVTGFIHAGAHQYDLAFAALDLAKLRKIRELTKSKNQDASKNHDDFIKQ